jgi:hypothetical protein
MRLRRTDHGRRQGSVAATTVIETAAAACGTAVESLRRSGRERADRFGHDDRVIA